MRRTVLAPFGISALAVALLALKPHHLTALAGQPAPALTHSAPRSGPSTPAAGSATGTFTSDPVATPYGDVQVAAVLVKVRITAVQVLRAPDRGGRDRELAAYALPRLMQKALGAQRAQIDALSGAGYTSQGYTQSLQSALDRARA